MQFQFNSDSQIAGTSEIAGEMESLVRGRLDHVTDRLTRVEVHVGDVNGPRGGDDVKCVVELRPTGMQPVSGTDQAGSIEAAVQSATDKALTSFRRQIGKRTTRKGH